MHESPGSTDGKGDGKLVMESVSELMAESVQSSATEREAFLVYGGGEDERVPTSHLINLTCGLGGLQVVWSVILSNGSPFLVSLGLSKSLTALVWIAAPLCGSIVQPIVGSISDRTSSRLGRRRPFILAGTLGVVIFLGLLAWAEEIARQVVTISGGDVEAPSAKAVVVSFAVSWIYALNVSIQLVQAGIRALIVENCPLNQQSQASTYASVMTGVGNILGYLFGFGILPALRISSVTRFQMLCLFASICLSATAIISCIKIPEKRARTSLEKTSNHPGTWAMFLDLKRTYKRMPRRIRDVCYIQFLAWMGWFPFLFYSTTYVGELYTRQMGGNEASNMDSRVVPSSDDPYSEKTPIGPEAIRSGTFASFLFAVVAFVYNLLLPYILKKSSGSKSSAMSLKDTSHSVSKAWTYSHGFFALLMFTTFFAGSQATATAIVACAGFSWALTLFAPFAIVSTELAAQQALQRDYSTSFNDVADDSSLDHSNRTGAIMGLHNVAISAPQILAALVCSAIYAVTNAPEVEDGTGWVLRAGGLAALGAMWLCSKFE